MRGGAVASEERQWLPLQLQAGRHGQRHRHRHWGWGEAAARQKVAMGEGLLSLSVKIKAVSPVGRVVTPCVLVQLPEFSLSVL